MSYNSPEVDNHINILNGIAEENGIERTTWSYDDYAKPVRDFLKG